MANRLSNGPLQVTNVSVEELNYAFQRVRQELDEMRGLRGPIQIYDTIPGLTLAETQITFTDVTTGNVTSTKHGFAPKSPADATKFLNGADTPDYALVKDSDLSTSDITTNNASTLKHGFLKKLSGAATDFLDGTGAFDTVKDSDLSTSDITTNNATTAKHGFTPKYPNDATKYLDGTGAYTVPAGGSAVTDATISTGDITTNNVSTTKHGWTPKAPNDATKYLDGTGAYSVPAGTGTSGGANDRGSYSTQFFMKDDFSVGAASTADIGELGWNIGGSGSVAYVATAEASHPGILTRTASAGAASTVALHLKAATTAPNFIFSETFDSYIILRPNSTADITLRIGHFGAGTTSTDNPPTDGIYFERLSTDTNWFGITRASSAETRTDTSVAGTTSFKKFRIRRTDASTIGFSIDGGTEVTSTTNIPTGNAGIVLQVRQTTATAKSYDVDYFDTLISGMSR